MIACLIFACVLYMCKNAGITLTGTEDLTNPLPPTSLSQLQYRFREDWNIQSFAGRPQFEHRGPYGPSPDQKYIQSQEFFDNEYYQKRYQKDKFAMDIKNQHWKLDMTTNSMFNNFGVTPHQPEDNLRFIKDFANTDMTTQNQNQEFFQQ